MTHVIDPITKKSIPIADMTEHMRIQLLDPKWAAEKAKFLEKQKESNLVSGDEIARNMMTFAKGRTDLFGTAVSAIKMTFLLLNPSRMLYINCID
jgi:splicing factor 3A subunit 1